MPARKPLAKGRSGHRWRTIKSAFRAKCVAAKSVCWLCGQRIDYTLKFPHPESFEPDHYHPVSTHPELAEDPANLRPSHRDCNLRRGNKAPTLGLGRQSRKW
ncbi:HNH endonuclease [Gordonia phage Dardanus]|uniref:HNH endonuclease n=1 Tax=Gordonia phage Dardanus TaxID=2588489 RepID=A0A514CX52_9CAUD|nr:HNH endonuclease [Gordonia phage Dardanus]QDH85095.1 HNH endonuclease [Gordonia phage Dardanus]